MQNTTPSLEQLTFIAALSAIQPAIATGAMCGALIYLLNSNKLPLGERLIFLVVSFIGGMLAASSMSSVMEGVLGLIGINATIGHPVGAFIAAALIVNMTIKLSHDPIGIIRKLREALLGQKESP